jgi:lipopolysaccharide/colanic/teichoic acid biosynthesis glycosyltransferase/NDP-sugar pyrophosphorylase family protein
MGGESVSGVVLAGSHRWNGSSFERLAPRPLLPVALAPLISYSLRWLRAGGVRSATICANGATRLIETACGDGRELEMDLHYFQDSTPRGPAGCVRDAGMRSDAVVVTDGTAIPTVDLAQVLASHEASGAAVTAVVHREGSRQARPTPTGVYVFERRALEHIAESGFQDIKETLIPRLHRAGERVVAHESHEICPHVFDAQTYVAANQWMLQRLAREEQATGEILLYPDARVDQGARLVGPVQVGPGAHIRSGATIVGPTSIGCGAVVGRNALVARSVLWSRSVVGEAAVVHGCVVGEGAAVARAARLFNVVRPQQAQPDPAGLSLWRQGKAALQPDAARHGTPPAAVRRRARSAEAALKALAILLDTRPRYVGAAGPTSLLLMPLGTATVVRYLGGWFSSLGHRGFMVVTDFEPGADYERRIADSGAPVSAIVPARELAARIADDEPSDWLVMLDPRCIPSRGLTPSALGLDSDDGACRARHVIALEAPSAGTTERVHLGTNGSVRRIQRYYPATWPFTAGVVCSLLPVSCAVGLSGLTFVSLPELRRSLIAHGVPSSDVFIGGGAFDLSQEHDLLALSERLVIGHFSARPGPDARWIEVGRGSRMHPSARLLGPVVLHDGAVIGQRATVVGPAVIGTDARVERDAVVAQCIVGPGAVIAPGLTLRHRAVCGAVSEALPPPALPSPYGLAAAPALPSSKVSDDTRGPRGAYAVLKAAFDVAVAAVALLVLSPLLLAIAALIKLESRGPVFYRDRREGKGGRLFECLKFRTMFVGADAQQRELLGRNEVDGPQFKLVHDPRVTRLGRILRKVSLDELPQLINVLRLEMSLVGPRPSPFRENQLCIPWREGRLSVRPGITGLWQVCRQRRLQGDFHQWIHFDLLYVQHMSFRVDLKILAATVLTLAGQWPVSPSLIVPLGEAEGDPAGGDDTAVAPGAGAAVGQLRTDKPGVM